MNFRILQKSDVDKLFQFELDNRRWFEKHIAARESDFYSKFKVEKYIIACLAEFHTQVMYPAIIEVDDVIIARVNFRNINLEKKTADIGYRVAESESGKGVASFAVSEMLEIAEKNFCLKNIKSYVSATNIASQRVLEKYAFKQVKLHKDFVVVSGQKKDCFEYQFKVSSLA